MRLPVMDNAEARFILQAYRPNGSDARDPLFAEPLERVRKDAKLAAWFEQQRSFDTIISAKLREVPPPAGLRESILAGVRVSAPARSRRPWGRWLAAAAALALLGAVAVRQVVGTAARPELYDLAQAAWRDTAVDGPRHRGVVPGLAAITHRLSAGNLRFAGSLGIDLAQLHADGCRTVRLGGRNVFEICFGPKNEFHLFLADSGDFLPSSDAHSPLWIEQAGLASATWADSRVAYSLVSQTGAVGLRHLLGQVDQSE